MEKQKQSKRCGGRKGEERKKRVEIKKKKDFQVERKHT